MLVVVAAGLTVQPQQVGQAAEETVVIIQVPGQEVLEVQIPEVEVVVVVAMGLMAAQAAQES
jgi:hypothetical protein